MARDRSDPSVHLFSLDANLTNVNALPPGAVKLVIAQSSFARFPSRLAGISGGGGNFRWATS